MKIDALRLQVAAVSELLRLLKQDLRKADADAELPPPPPKKATQVELPAMPPSPPRAKSQQQILFDTFNTKRSDVFEFDLGAPFEADEVHGPAFINVAFQPIVAALNNNLGSVEELMEAFFRDPWAASLKPPFPFKAFASNKTWPRLITERRERIATQGRT